ncbi:MAG TPA: aldolase/citrate lyase family protein [Acidimicrobiales bacterium]|nr:aldolase/citrate lyase family protein [Acidimicrobiales bacterium]
MSTNRLKSMLDEGGTAFGAWCVLGSPVAAELCSVEAADYLCVDLQHGLGHLDAMIPMLMVIGRTGASPIVRVPSNQAHHIGKALDAGAEAVIVPMVNSRSEAERAVEACRYAPGGARSFGPVRARLFLNQERPSEVNEQVLCIVMIETIGAVELADEICSTPGVDGVYVGPADLALTMGVAPGFDELPRAHGEAIEHVRLSCEARGIVAGIHTSGGEQSRAYAKAGFRMLTVSTDAALLRMAVHRELAIARGGADEAARSGGYA